FWSYDVAKTEEWLSSMAENGFVLVKINRGTRCFFFEKCDPHPRIYRIVFDRVQTDSLSRGLVDEGWVKVLQTGKWSIIANERPLNLIRTSPVREGIINHNRIIMYIFGGILFYLSMSVSFIIMTFLPMLFFDAKIEVVESPYWFITYLFFALEITLFVLCIYSVIKIYKSNQKLIAEKRKDFHPIDSNIARLSKADEKRLKKNGQLVVKRKFGWMYSPDKLEKWLEKLEEQGYNLYRISKIGTVFYFFNGSPRKISYCADYQNMAEDSNFDIHKDSGWQCVFTSFSSLQKWTIWSREYSKDEERPQIYSDKSNHLKHAKRIAITYTCIFLPLVLAYCFNMGMMIDLLFRTKRDPQILVNLIIIFFAIISFGSFTIRTWLYFIRLKKRFDYNL
ncbi:MAG TPA: DUF2812 domain-containing protein, partial [Neobacillus sp.]